MVIDYRDFPDRFNARVDRWGLMEEFLRDWELPNSPGGLIPLAEREAIRASAEERLQFRLPAAYNEWCQLPFNPFVAEPRLYWTHMLWFPDLEVWPEGAGADGLVVFKREYQNCCEWAFRVRDAGLDDPPVFIGSTQNEDVPVTEWQLQNATFSGFMLQLLMVRSVNFATRVSAFKRVAPQGTWDLIQKHFRNLGFPNWLEYGADCQLFGGRDILLLTDCAPPWGMQHNLSVNARSTEALEEATNLLGFKWDRPAVGTWVENLPG